MSITAPTPEQYARRINAARQAWRDLPTPDSAWGLQMKAKIARYYFVKESEMDGR